MGGPVGERSSQIAGFVSRRFLALAYCSAFLALLCQVDGIFGCGGIHGLPVKGLPFTTPGARALPLAAICLVGGLLAGGALIASKILEEWSGIVFFSLWVLFFNVVSLGGPIIDDFEDRFLLEAGLACLLAASGGGSEAGPHVPALRRLGRLAAAFLLFRVAITAGSQQLAGPCGAWRDLTAMQHGYQLEPFPLPSGWPLSQGPQFLGRLLTLLKMYSTFVVVPLMLLPWRSVAQTAAFWQFLGIVGSSLLANRGVLPLCEIALVFALLDDRWHLSMWSWQVLKNWGCEVPNIGDQKPSGDAKGKAAKDEDSSSSSSSGSDEDEEVQASEDHTVAVFATLVVGYIVSVGLLLVAGGTHGTLQDLFSLFGAKVTPSFYSQLAQSLALLGAVGTAIQFLKTISVNADMGAGKGYGSLAALLAVAIWFAGVVALSRDLSSKPIGTQDKFPFQSLTDMMQAMHVSHSFVDDVSPCPDPSGRADVLFQGILPLPEGYTGDGYDLPPDIMRPLDLSSRFLPTSAERRPMWLQPFAPRLDREIWRLAQKPPADQKSMPAWSKRLSLSLALRDGGAARLSIGSWDGPEAVIYPVQPESPLDKYAKLKPPLAGIQVVWLRSEFMDDEKSNKWWNVTDAKALARFDAEELLGWAKIAKKRGHCEAPFWRAVPVAEALAALLVAAFLWSVALGGSAIFESKPKGKATRRRLA